MAIKEPKRSTGRIKASPLARKRARAARILLHDMAGLGSGPGGRIIARDVAQFEASHEVGRFEAFGRSTFGGGDLEHDYGAGLRDTSVVALRPWQSGHDDATSTWSLPAADEVETSLARQVYAPGSYAVQPHDSFARRAAAHLSDARRHVPQTTLRAEVRVRELHRSIERMNLGPGMGRVTAPLALTVSDVLVKAMGLALRQVAEANVSYTPEAMLHHAGADVAVAILPDATNLLDGGEDGRRGPLDMALPVIAHADFKSLSEISEELDALRVMAREGRLERGVMAGGVTTIFDFTHVGVNGCETLVVPPQSSVLVLGAGEDKAVLNDGTVRLEPVAQLSLGFDQRAIGMGAAMRVLAVVRSYLEDPMRMLV